ncbi:MAG: ABC transporter permease [Deinococcales bacterium]
MESADFLAGDDLGLSSRIGLVFEWCKETIGLRLEGWECIIVLMLAHMFLPTLTFSLVFLGEYMLIMRTRFPPRNPLRRLYLNRQSQRHCRFGKILKDHAVRNAMLPIVTIALNLGFTVAGAVYIEQVFSYRLGLTIYEAVGQRDFPFCRELLLLAFSVIIANLFADLLYSYPDPRVRLTKSFFGLNRMSHHRACWWSHPCC